MAEDGSGALAQFCMLVIGVGYLFPISAIWAAFDYWKVLFPDSNIEFVVTGVYQVGSMVTVTALTLAAGGDLGTRILGGFGGQFCCLAAIMLFRWLPVDNAELLQLLLVCVLLCSVATGYLDSALFALCSQYQNDMQRFLQIGIGFGTMVSVFYRDLTKLIMSSDVADATSLYFVVALATVVTCISCYRLLMSLPVSRHVKLSTVSDDSGGDLILSPPLSPGPVFSPTMPSTPVLDQPRPQLGERLVDQAGDPSINGTGLKAPESAKFRAVFPKVWRNQLTIFLNLTLTTLCYPGMITSIPCRQFFSLAVDHWFQTLLLTGFTVADIAGRFMTKYTFGLNHANIWLTVVVRMFLSPVIIYCILSPDAGDVMAFAVVAAFGFMNGYCVSQALIVPNQIPGLTGAQRKTCGFISACSVNSGLCAGSLLAAAVAEGLGLSHS